VLAPVVAAVLLALAAGCNGGGGEADGGAAPDRTVCDLLGRLDRTGEPVAEADAQDPTAFDDTLSDAVEEYIEILGELHDAVPSDLRDDVERLRVAVEQYRFADGVEPRAALARYGTESCA
jgi:hypothetical protein